MTTLLEAMGSVGAWQSRVRTDNVVMKAVHIVPPENSGALPMPCIVDSPSRLVETQLGPNGLRIRVYEIKAQLFMADISASQVAWTKTALALDQDFQDRFAGNLKLGDGNIHMRALVGDEPWYGIQETPNGLAGLGLAYLFELRIDDEVDVDAGSGD